MRVIVSGLESAGPAGLALHAEGTSFEFLDCRDSDTAYADGLAEIWREGKAFVLLTSDVVPFVGAVRKLATCPAQFCVHRYYSRAGYLVESLGCVKFGEALVGATGGIERKWIGKHFDGLDSRVFSAVSAARLVRSPHRHAPPLAHCWEPWV